MKLPLIILDLETTGTSPKDDRIVQICCIKLLENGENIVKKTLVNPGVPIPAQATECHGITGDGNYPQEWHDKNFTAAMNRVSEFGERVKVLRGLSAQMAQWIPNNSIALVYVDADHSKKGCSSDIDVWYPKLKPGGVMAFHDYERNDYGVKEAVNEFAAEHGLEVHFIAEDKLEDAGAWFMKK